MISAASASAIERVLAGTPEQADTYRLLDHWWAMAIDIEKCIGCGNCVRACKKENDVPLEPLYFRTGVERYHVEAEELEHPVVDSPTGGYDGFPERYRRGDGARASAFPSSATTARTLGASRSAPTAAASSTHGPGRSTGAACATTASPRA